MSSTNLVLLLVTAAFTLAYVAWTNRAAQSIAGFFARHLPRPHVHTPHCGHAR